MSELIFNFPTPTLEQWKNQFSSELKGQDPSILEINDEIEELSYMCYQHTESEISNSKKIKEISDFSSFSKANNDWRNCGTVMIISNNETEAANKKALQLLEFGADALRFILPNESIDLDLLSKGIEFQYIHSYFVISSMEQFDSLNHFFSAELLDQITIECDGIEFPELFVQLVDANKVVKNIIPATFIANGSKIQQAGATTWQEIGFCLSAAHHYLHTLLSQGKTTEEANTLIQFNIGIGGDYFYEIAKLMILKALWNTILTNYNPDHKSSETKTLALTGFMNKSVKDPHTNLLRQTTEVMSGASAGALAIAVQPYDLHSTNGESEIAQRMGINIATILKEESYFDAVQNPQIGSYTTKLLCDLISEKSWNYFQELESLDGITTEECQQKLKLDIALKADLRIKRFIENTDCFIGINIFQSKKEELNDWKKIHSYLGNPALILEQHINKEKL